MKHVSSEAHAEQVSVIVPSYNRAHLLPETVESLLAQSVALHEILIIDDGSIDNTRQVCEQFPEPVRYIHQDNTGLPGARNRGFAEASGEWLALCDSDDLWHPRKLELQLRALRAVPDARWALTGCRLIDPDGNPLPGSRTGFTEVFPVFAETGRTPAQHFRDLNRSSIAMDNDSVALWHGDLYELLFHGNVALPSSAVIHRSAIDRVGGFDPCFGVAEETEFFHRLAAAAPAVIIDEALVEYRVGHPSIVNSGDPSRLIQNAILSGAKAYSLREHSPSATEAFEAGRRRLHERLAYALLTKMDGAGARAVLRSGQCRTLRAAAIYALSLAPPAFLRLLYRLRRRFR